MRDPPNGAFSNWFGASRQLVLMLQNASDSLSLYQGSDVYWTKGPRKKSFLPSTQNAGPHSKQLKRDPFDEVCSANIIRLLLIVQSCAHHRP